MAFSYSFHISTKSHAVTSVGKVGQVEKHNLRKYKSDEYDKNLINVIAGSDDLLRDLKKIYHQEFDEPLKKYNERVRTDRQIKDYLEHVSNSRSDVAVEIIIQVGDKDFWEDKNLSERKQMTQIFEEQIEALQGYCPNFKLVNATIHYDEASPHVHIVGVPVADGYKKGMKKQVAKTKVFTQESLSMLQDSMRERMEQSMKAYPQLFEDMELKEKENGRNKDIPKYALDEFYKIEARNEELVEELNENYINALEKQYEVEFMIEREEETLSEVRQKLSEARESLSKLEGDINVLSTDKNALEGKIEALSEERQILETAIKKKTEESVGQFTLSGMEERLAQARKEADKTNRLNLLERFVSLSTIKPLFEQFCKTQKKIKNKDFER